MIPSLLSFLLFLFSVKSQNYPYVSFAGQSLANHSYVNFSAVGENPSTSVRCVTDLNICCTERQGHHRGDWYNPNGTKLPFSGRGDIYEVREERFVNLRRIRGAENGIYRCEIPTKDFYVITNVSVRDIVYVGIYADGGGSIVIPGNMNLTINSDLNGPSPQFTFTCISTGGPATNVTWTRDSIILTEGTETVLNDPVTAQYTHTLTMTGRIPGLYTCTVANNKPSSDSKNLEIQMAVAPIGVKAVQNSATSVIVSWIPSPLLGDTNGYRVTYYTSETTHDIKSIDVDVSTNKYTLKGLQRGLSYIISLLATSKDIHSYPITFQVTLQLVPAPGEVSVEVTSITATSISLSWSVASGSVSSWEVVWRETDRGTESLSGSLPGTSYTIDQLDSTTIYTVRVTATNVGGTTSSNTLYISTASDVCPPEGNCTDFSNSPAAIIGGIAFILIILPATAIVIVILVLRYRRRQLIAMTSLTPKTLERSVELSKIPDEPIYVEPDVFVTSSNESYGVLKCTRGARVEGEYH